MYGPQISDRQMLFVAASFVVGAAVIILSLAAGVAVVCYFALKGAGAI